MSSPDDPLPDGVQSRNNCGLRCATAITLLMGLIALVFGELIDTPYLFDDRSLLLEDGHLSGETPWTGWWWQPHPVRYLSFAVDRAFGFNPAAGHAFNLLIHALNAYLVWLLLRRQTRIPLLAPLVAGAFALHPMAVEVVGIVSHRKDLLAATGVLVGLWVAERKRLWWMMWPAWMFAFFAKETAIVFPALWVLQRMTLGHLDPRMLLRRHHRLCAGLALSALVLGLAGWSIAEHRPMEFGGGSSFVREATNVLPADAGIWDATVAACMSFVRYVLHAWFPLTRSIDPPAFTLMHAATWMRLGVVVLAGLWTLAGISLALRRRPEAFGWWWGTLALSPVVFPWLLQAKGVFLFADRYIYLALPGFVFVLVHWAYRYYKILLPLWLVALVTFTVNRVGDFATEETFWAATLRSNPDSVWALNNLAALDLEKLAAGEVDDPEKARRMRRQSEDFLSHALDLQPDFVNTRINLAAMYLAEGRLEAVGKELDRAEALAPGMPELAGLRAMWWAAGGAYDQAIPRLRQLLEVTRDPLQRHRYLVALVHCLLEAGSPEMAWNLLADRPTGVHPELDALRIRIHTRLGRFQQAQQAADRAWSTHEGVATVQQVCIDLDIYLFNWSQAETRLRELLRRSPRQPEWALRLARLMRYRGEFENADELEHAAGIYQPVSPSVRAPAAGRPQRLLLVRDPEVPVDGEVVQDLLSGQGYPLMHVYEAEWLAADSHQGMARVLGVYDLVAPSLVVFIGGPRPELDAHTGLGALHRWVDLATAWRRTGTHVVLLMPTPDEGPEVLRHAVLRYRAWSGAPRVRLTEDDLLRGVSQTLDAWFADAESPKP